MVQVKGRYIAAGFAVVSSIIATPLCMELAYISRGYRAFGGECLLVLLGLLLAVLIVQAVKFVEDFLYYFKEVDGNDLN